MQHPCPNPVCSHVFSHAEVQRASALKCPRCGHEFRLRSEPSAPKPAAQPAPAPAAPLAKLVQPKPAAVPAQAVAVFPGRPANPFADAAPTVPASAEETGNIDFGPPSTLIRRNAPGKRPPPPKAWKKYVVLAVLALVVIGAMGTAYIYVPWSQMNRRSSTATNEGRDYVVTIRNLKGNDERAFKVILPEAGTWTYDREIIDDFRLRDDSDNIGESLIRETGVDLALRHREKDVWIAFAAKDYGMRLPRAAEMLYQASLRLTKFFGETLETAPKVETITLAGKQGFRLRFKGESRSVVHKGECYMVANNGMGYWLFVGAPSWPEAQQGLTDLQADGKGFTFATTRKGWVEQPPRMVTFNGERYPLSLTAIEGIWEKQSNGREFEETSDLYLLGNYLKEKNNRKNSSVMVLILPKQETLKDAVKFARKYAEDRRKGPKNFNYSHVLITPEGEDADKDAEQGQKADVGNKPGRVLEMKVLLGDEPARYMMLAIVNEPDAAVVVWCECIWDYRQMWREDFRELLSSVNIRKRE